MKITQNTHKESGFTLIELAIVFVIIGLIAAGFASQYKEYLSEKIKTAQQDNINEIRDALASHSLNGIRNARGVDADGDGVFSGTGEIDFAAEPNGRLLVENNAGTLRTIGSYAEQTAGTTVEEYFHMDTINDGVIISGYSLPCPAPLNIGLNDAGSGASFADPNPAIPTGPALDCDDSNLTLGFNDGGNGVYVVEGLNGGRVIIGAVPYEALGIPASKTLDAYKNKIFYAVTGTVTTAGALDGSPPAGGIEIDNGAGTPPVRTQFMLFSAGHDGLGAWNADGVQSASLCPAAGSAQRANCLFTTGDTSTAAASFAIQDFVNDNTTDHFDDTLAFTFTDGGENAFFTRGASTSGTAFDIINKNPGDIVLSASLIANQNLEAKSSLTVGNSARIGDTTGTQISKLDIDGEMKLSSTGLACNTTNPQNEGAVRYNATEKCLEFCDGTDWQISCQPGCVDGGSRYEVGQTTTQTANDSCTTTTRTCQNDGTWSLSSDSSACNIGCPRQHVIWSGLGGRSGICHRDIGSGNHGETRTVIDPAPGNTGSAIFTCNNGTWERNVIAGCIHDHD